MVQDAEEGHREDRETKKDWTGKPLVECTTTARNRKSLRELLRRSVVSDLQQLR